MKVTIGSYIPFISRFHNLLDLSFAISKTTKSVWTKHRLLVYRYPCLHAKTEVIQTNKLKKMDRLTSDPLISPTDKRMLYLKGGFSLSYRMIYTILLLLNSL